VRAACCRFWPRDFPKSSGKPVRTACAPRQPRRFRLEGRYFSCGQL